jgi:LysR family transcriptional activator of nhaA
MQRLNYHHLLYFYTVAREGSVARASARLGVAQPTISAQVHALEKELGVQLLARNGRGIRVTAAGETVVRYAESIFARGAELLSLLDGGAEAAPELAAGVSSALPPGIASQALRGVFAASPRPRLTVVEGPAEALCAQLASHALHFVLADQRCAGVHSRVLFESAIALYAPPALARRLRRGFSSRDKAVPVLMPSSAALRREVEPWLERHKLSIEKIGEMPHPELYAAAAGAAVFAPAFAGGQLKSANGLLPVAELDGTRWQLLLLTPGRALTNPAIGAVIAAAHPSKPKAGLSGTPEKLA